MSAPSTPPPPPTGAGAPVPGLPMPGSAPVMPKDYDRRVSPSPVQLNYLLPSQSEIHLIWNHKMYNTSKSSEVENWTRLVTDILEDLRRKQEAWGQPNFRGRRRRVENDLSFGAQSSSLPMIIGSGSAAAGGNGINPSTTASQITTTTITLPNSVSGVAGDGAVPPPPPNDPSSSANGDTILISPNAPPMPVPSSHSSAGPSSSTTTIHVVSSNASGAGPTTTSVPLVITTSTPMGGMSSASSALNSSRDVSCDNKECDHNVPFMIACSSTVFTGDVDIAEVVSAESWRKQAYWNGRPHLPHNRTTKLHVVVKENKRRLEYTLHVNLSSTTGVNGKRRDTRAKCIILPLPDLRDSQKRPIYAVMQPPPFRARGSVYLTMEGWARLDLLRSNAEFEVFIFNNEENLPITVELGWCGRNPTTYPVDAARRKRKRERTKGVGPITAAAPPGLDPNAWRNMLATFAPALAAAQAAQAQANASGVTSPTLSGKTGEEKTAGGKKRKGAAAAAAAAAANPGGIMIRPFQWPVDPNAPESERKTNILSMVAGSFLTNAAGGQGLPIMKLENGVPVPVGLAFSPPGARPAGATDGSGDASAAASSSTDGSGATSVVGVTSSTDGVAADGSAAAAAGTNAQQQFVLIPFPASGAGFPTIFPFPQMFPVNSQGKISMILPNAGTDGSVVSAEAGAEGQGDEKEASKGKKKGGRKGKGAKRARKGRRGKDEDDGGDDSADAETESDRESGSDDDDDKKDDKDEESHRRGGRKRGRGAAEMQPVGAEHHGMAEPLGDPHAHHQ